MNSNSRVLFNPSSKEYGALKTECAFDASNFVVAQNFLTLTELIASFFRVIIASKSNPYPPNIPNHYGILTFEMERLNLRSITDNNSDIVKSGLSA